MFVMLTSGFASAKLLDKILAITDGHVFTLSLVNRIKSNVVARKNISPFIYSKNSFTDREVIEVLVQTILIRDKLSEMGYVINDDTVESKITETEQRLGFNRDYLRKYLSSHNMTFDEYFELMRETIEFNIFNSRVIRPMISVTDQEIKNTFYKANINNKTLSFKYTLVDFSLEKRFFKKGMLKKFKRILQDFQISGSMPELYKNVETNVLGDIAEDNLDDKLQNLLKKTDEGAFTSPYFLNNSYHVFFVKRKDLVESEIFMAEKQKIKVKLFEKIAKQITKVWYQREKHKHFIKYFVKK